MDKYIQILTKGFCTWSAGQQMNCTMTSGNALMNIEKYARKKAKIVEYFDPRVLTEYTFVHISLRFKPSTLSHSFVGYVVNDKILIAQSFVDEYSFEINRSFSLGEFVDLMHLLLQGTPTEKRFAYHQLFLVNVKKNFRIEQMYTSYVSNVIFYSAKKRRIF